VFAGDYAAVLMDCQMPEMDGYAATAEIRGREADGRHVPIIAMTAHSMKGDRERCLAAGMDDHVPKPVQGEAVDAALARWVHPVDGNGGDPIDRPTLDRLRAELGGLDRADALDSVIRQFVETAPDGVAAIVAACDCGDPEAAGQEAHTLKGASATFGAVRLAAVCEAIEQAGHDGDLERARSLVAELEVAARATEAALQIGLQPSRR